MLRIQNNERDIELPWAKEIVDQYQGKRILEIGYCLNIDYPEVELTDIVCKYDKEGGDKVHRVDILDWRAPPYDLIISVSTFEHIGKDYDEVNDGLKSGVAIRYCYDHLLKPEGQFAMSIPIGWRRDLEHELTTTNLVPNMTLLRRVDSKNNWVEVPVEDMETMDYPGKWGAAEGVLFCLLK